MKFANLKIQNWRQFSDIDISFHPKMTIITGSNGAGKSTILKILAQHFGWNTALLATPKLRRGGNGTQYSSGIYRRRNLKWSLNSIPIMTQVGQLSYSNGSVATLHVPELGSGSATFSVQINGQNSIQGLSINSHRPNQNYQPITSIPTVQTGVDHAYNVYSSEMMQRYNNGYTQYSPVYRMKEALISMAMFGAGNQYVEKNESLEKSFIGFKNILAEILPPSIGFKDISVRPPEVVLVTNSGEFMIDAASGGLMALIDLAWQIFLYSKDKFEFTVLLDEPENHLHPSMQRSLLGRLTSAFPQAQFIVATHSPFVVSSIKDSHVHVLRYENENIMEEAEEFSSSKVNSIMLDLDTKAATANEILRDVLGVPVTLPQWAEDELKDISSSININTITSVDLNDLRARLSKAGLSEFFPEVLKMAAGQTND